MQIEQLPLSKMRRRFDARPLNKESIPGLMSSIKELGILSPLRVRPVKLLHGREEVDGWEITAGCHRFEAAWELNLETVPCIVVTEDDLRAELAMIDENLIRAELGPIDRAKQTARRKEIYIELHPKSASGQSQAIGMHQALGHDVADNLSTTFAGATAAAIGKSDRDVRRDAERGKKICDLAANLVRGTKLDAGKYLDKLKDVPESEQLAKVEKDLADLELTTARADKASKEAEQNRKAADKETRATDQEIARVNADEFAEWLLARTDLGELPMIYSWLAATKPKDVAEALRRRAA